MNIAFDIRSLLDARYSGVSWYTLELARAMMRNDAHNTYTLFYNALKTPRNLPHFDQENASLVGWRYPNKLLNYGTFRWLNRPRIDKALNADVVLLPHFNFIGMGHTPSVAIVHDLSFLRHPRYFSWRQNIWHRAMNVRSFLHARTHLIAVSHHTKRDVVELMGIEPERITVVHSGISPHFKPLPPNDSACANLQARYHLPKDFILYLGNLEPRKNVEGIIEAYSLYRTHNPAQNIGLVIAGAPAWKHAGIRRAAAASPFQKDIIFLDYIPDADRGMLYTMARVFMFPSFYEGFGFPPLEAMACGTPTIVSNLSALPETAGPAALAVNPYDVGEMAHALQTLLHEKETYALLQQEGIDWARRYNWETTAREVREILSKVAAQ